MILVTVGTVGFEALIVEVDRLAAAGRLEPDVFAQIGASRYLPQAVRFERYRQDLRTLMAAAELIITHAGTGSVCECIASGRPFIAVIDAGKAGNHQLEFAVALAERFDYCWIERPEQLEAALPQARAATPLDRHDAAALAADIRHALRA
jgi:UDP-N-acetylglucosamine transferase subunit ALG13